MQPVVGIPRGEFYVTTEVRHEKRGSSHSSPLGSTASRRGAGMSVRSKPFEDTSFTPYVARTFVGQTVYPTTKHVSAVAPLRVNDRDGVHGRRDASGQPSNGRHGRTRFDRVHDPAHAPGDGAPTSGCRGTNLSDSRKGRYLWRTSSDEHETTASLTGHRCENVLASGGKVPAKNERLTGWRTCGHVESQP